MKHFLQDKKQLQITSINEHLLGSFSIFVNLRQLFSGLNSTWALAGSFQSMGHEDERVKVLFPFFSGWLSRAPHNRYIAGFGCGKM